MDSCDAFEYTKSTKKCQIFKGVGIKGDGKASAWKQVRFMPKDPLGVEWDRNNDNLSGSERFGDPESTSSSWGIPFDNLDYSKVKVEALEKMDDGSTFMNEYDNYDIIGKLNHQDYF